MGIAKSLLNKGSTTLGCHLANLLASALNDPPILAGNGPIAPPWEAVAKLKDDPEIDGPLGGFVALNRAYPETAFIALAVDLYFWDKPALDWLLFQAAKAPELALWPKHPGRPFGEPLAAYYSPASIRAMAAAGQAGERALHRALPESLRREPEIPLGHQLAFRNVNRPEDLPYSTKAL